MKEDKKKNILKKSDGGILQVLSLKAVVKIFEGLALCSPHRALGSVWGPGNVQDERSERLGRGGVALS